MQTRILHTEIWQDDFFSELTPDEKLLFIYFLTNERVNIIHLYQCTNARIKADTGIDTPIIEIAKEKFEDAGKIYFHDTYVFLKNASKYETYTGSMNEIAKSKLYSRISKTVIDWYNNITDTPIDTPIDTHKKQEIRNKKQVIRNIELKVEDCHHEDINPNDIPF